MPPSDTAKSRHSSAHAAEGDRVQRDIVRAMTPARRLELAVGMQQQSRDLMNAGLQMSHPQLSAAQRQREIARRILHART
jgi:hypothetical protein